MFEGLRLQHWRPQHRGDGIVVLTLDRADQNVNALSRGVLDELASLVERLAIEKPKGVVFISGKKAGFIPGADIKGFEAIHARGETFDWIRSGQLLFDRISKLPFPTVAAIHGHCMGGGTELSLACRYRVASSADNTRIGLPEVKLGIYPGGGGSVRAPKLLG
ncbi:MAG: enoyl-CoA hydratase-related protein, partial [Lysobacteraceae bacterium]